MLAMVIMILFIVLPACIRTDFRNAVGGIAGTLAAGS